MDFSVALSTQERALTDIQVDAFNKKLGEGRVSKNEMDKDDFMNILITQLTHQDPTSPMEDKEFIAQMAQFSSLEQITNMKQEFTKMASSMTSGQAFSMVGQNVTIVDGDVAVNGVVDAVSGRDFPQVLVNGTYYDYSKVQTVSLQEPQLASN
ncbi:MAG: flagellar hook assembly protein FlgD [Spirochaetales bacterium]|nr:flagellar hook assembly protein FlgD [Spirochaetales bacterium]